MSCGGPIIDPSLDCYVMVPICPHTLSDRPLVLPDNISIEIELQQNNKNKAEVTIDGRSICEFSESDKLIITKSLRSNYKNPQQIAHKVLADRMGIRDPGNKPKPGDRIRYLFFVKKNKEKNKENKKKL